MQRLQSRQKIVHCTRFVFGTKTSSGGSSLLRNGELVPLQHLIVLPLVLFSQAVSHFYKVERRVVPPPRNQEVFSDTENRESVRPVSARRAWSRHTRHRLCGADDEVVITDQGVLPFIALTCYFLGVRGCSPRFSGRGGGRDPFSNHSSLGCHGENCSVERTAQGSRNSLFCTRVEEGNGF